MLHDDFEYVDFEMAREAIQKHKKEILQANPTKCRSCKIERWNDQIALTFHRRLDNAAAETPDEFQSSPMPQISRLHDFPRSCGKTSHRLMAGDAEEIQNFVLGSVARVACKQVACHWPHAGLCFRGLSFPATNHALFKLHYTLTWSRTFCLEVSSKLVIISLVQWLSSKG